MKIYQGYRDHCLLCQRDGIRADSRLASSQWETSLQGNTVSHWLFANLETAPEISTFIQPCSSYTYAGTRMNPGAIPNVCWLIPASYRFGYTIWDPKWFWIEVFTSHNRLHDKFEPHIFHTWAGFEFGIYRIFMVSNWKCIHVAFTMLWPSQQIFVSRWKV